MFKHKTIFSLQLLIIFLLFAQALQSAKSTSQELTKETDKEQKKDHTALFKNNNNINHLSTLNFTSVTGINIPPQKSNIETEWFILFYLSTCIHCKKAIPQFIKIPITKFSHVKLAAIQCSQNKNICKSFHIFGYPKLIYFIKDKKYEYKDYNRTEPLFTKFIENIHNSKGQIKQIQQYKDDQTFQFILYIKAVAQTDYLYLLILGIIIVGLLIYALGIAYKSIFNFKPKNKYQKFQKLLNNQPRSTASIIEPSNSVYQNLEESNI